MLASLCNECLRPKLWLLSRTLRTSTQSKTTKNAFAGFAKLRAQKFGIFFTPITTRTPIHVCCFQKWSKSVQDKWPKSSVAFLPLSEKNILRHLAKHIWGYFPHFCVIHHCRSSLISEFCLNQVWVSYSRKTLPLPPK